MTVGSRLMDPWQLPSEEQLTGTVSLPGSRDFVLDRTGCSRPFKAARSLLPQAHEPLCQRSPACCFVELNFI